MIYIEYISRRAGVSLSEFHARALAGQSGWADGYGDDLLLLNLARTWRIGPEPEYMTVWYSRTAGLERLDQWQAVFASGEAEAVEAAFASVARIDAAGCYEPLVEPVSGAVGPYYAEFFDLREGADPAAAARCLQSRGVAAETPLVLAVDRIGWLGPDPRGLAVWQLVGGFSALQQIGRRDDSSDVLSVVRAGVYADFGNEIL